MEKTVLLTAASQIAGGNKLCVALLDPSTLFGTPTHTHDYCEFFAIDGGSVGYSCSGVDSVIRGGELMFARPEDAHSFRKIESYGRFINIVVRQDVSARFFESLGGEALTDFLAGGRVPMEPGAAGRLFQAGEDYVTFSENEELRAKRLLCMLGDIILSARLERGRRPLPAWLDDALRACQAPEKFTRDVSALYALCGRSPAYVCRCFRKYLGMTPTDFLNAKRLSYSKRLLASTVYTVLDVSMLSGFNSLSHFNHLFLREFNMTPLTFRKAVASGNSVEFARDLARLPFAP